MFEKIFDKSNAIQIISEITTFFTYLKEKKKYCITIKEYREKKSTNSNNYAWVLLDKLAVELKRPKTEIYRRYIKEIGGVSEDLDIRNDAVERFCSAWERKGIGWQTELNRSEKEGYTKVTVYYGSSTYNTEEMSRLINLIVEDCKALGIETLSEEELIRLNTEWGAVFARVEE